ncbi:MAG: iron-sulfur cluster-binding domain-containing protein [Chitinophagaceae bacterium]|nr:MAG: iron-sulfur cluster-binding domain-containing protein [Chitinophagaceae bacterium]
MSASIIKRVQIEQIIAETADAKTFILLPLDGWEPVYKPGQFITLVFYTHSGEKRRSFSISSVPGEPLSITVKKVDNGEFSRLLIYKAAKGDILFTAGISGYFVLPETKSYETFFFLAAGSGITPCFSLIKMLLFGSNKKVILIYSNQSEAAAIFYSALQMLQQTYPERFQVRFLFSNRNNVLESRLSHWLLSHLLAEFLPAERSTSLFFTCGPADYMIMVGISLRANGIQSSQIIKEDFSPTTRTILPAPPDRDAHMVTILINGATHHINVQYPTSIVATAKMHHIELPYSCEAGKCGSCAATCLSGVIWMAYNEVLVDEEIAKGRVLTCQGFAVGGDATIQF